MDAQLRKGFLEFCILASLRAKDSYGYQMIKDLSEIIAITESTLYPILRRLEGHGWVTIYSVEHNSRIRKYFHLTEAGADYLHSFSKQREEILRILDYITCPEPLEGDIDVEK